MKRQMNKLKILIKNIKYLTKIDLGGEKNTKP